jgi:hypothetical protein
MKIQILQCLIPILCKMDNRERKVYAPESVIITLITDRRA